MTWDHLHDEDVLFEFRGDRPDQLTPGRFYRGTVDGFADFGVFVTLGADVTGLLHRNNIEGRLENLDWDVGDEVIVQVEGVRDNGNIDLGWSIRQSDAEFRGAGIDDPTGTTTDVEAEQPVAEPEPESDPEPQPDPAPTETDDSAGEVAAPSLETETVDAVSDAVGDRLRVVGRIDAVRQTNGPTIFTLADETGSIECAAFEAAGVRAFPDIEVEDVVAVIGRVEEHRGSVQLETEEMEPLTGSDRETVEERIVAAELERAQPDDTTLVVQDDGHDVDALEESATELRRAVFDRRAIVIRHPTTVDGVVAGAAIEHALRSLSERTFEDDGSGWFVTRRPMDESWYDLGDAMYDVTDAAERDDFIVIAGAGASEQDEAARSFLDVYQLDNLVIDQLGHTAGPEHVAPRATNIAGMIDDEVRTDLVHLPAIGVGYDVPEPYRSLADEHGYDADTIRARHEAIALVAYYQRYDDKRELIADLLFDGEEAGDLAEHVSGQFRERLDTAVETARQNAELIERQGARILWLNAAALTHRFSFPPRPVLAEALERESDVDVVLVLDEDTAFIAGDLPLSVDHIADYVDQAVSEGAVTASRDRITFLVGMRDDVRDAIIETVVAEST